MPIRLRCPDCSSLMQVADEAAGQKTQCPSCKKVIVVPAKTLQGPATTSPKPPIQGTQSPLDVRNPRANGPASPPPPSRPQKPAPSPVPTSAPAPLQVRCPRCQQLMRANPGSTVNCPHCSATVKIPRPGDASSASKPAATDLFEDLPPPTRPGAGFGPLASQGGFGGSTFGGPSAKRSPAQTTNPYASLPNFGQPGSGYSAGGYSGGGYSAGGGSSKNWQYTLLGIIFILWGALMMLGGLINVGTSIWFLAMGNGDADMTTVALIRLVGAFCVGLPISIVYLYGGFAFVNRSSLSAAKTVAVIAIIPCFNACILMPFGIWAAIVAFDGAAKRDFHN